jgi:hypothetical protein
MVQNMVGYMTLKRQPRYHAFNKQFRQVTYDNKSELLTHILSPCSLGIAPADLNQINYLFFVVSYDTKQDINLKHTVF